MTGNNSKNTAALTPEDVFRLMKERSPEARLEVVSKITYQYDNGQFSDSEIEIAEQILRFLTHDAEIRVRKTIADKLKYNKDLPKDIAKKLAEDMDEVAVPLLEASAALADSDLVDIIRKTNEAHQLAITRRESISASVSDALVETKSEKVVDSLLHNPKAEIQDASYNKIIDTFPSSKTIAESMISRKSVPVAITEKLMAKVSDTLRSYLQEKYSKNAPHITEVVEESREFATLNLLRPDASTMDIKDLVKHLHQTDRLTPSIIITSLCMNRLHFFEIALATIAGIPNQNAITLIQDADGLGFESLYKKTNLPPSLFTAVKLVLKANFELLKNDPSLRSQDKSAYANRLLEKVLSYAEGEEIENLPYVLTIIKKNLGVR